MKVIVIGHPSTTRNNGIFIQIYHINKLDNYSDYVYKLI